MLTSHEMDSGSPFAVLLVGQPTLRQRMRLGVLAALDQRIGMRYAMPPMTDQETADYIGHHTTIAGRSDTLFTADAITVIHNAGRGYPRAINNLGVHALTAAYARRQPRRRRKSRPRRAHRNRHRLTGPSPLTTTTSPRRPTPPRHQPGGR